jgi:hypothetical protein
MDERILIERKEKIGDLDILYYGEDILIKLIIS